MVLFERLLTDNIFFPVVNIGLRIESLLLPCIFHAAVPDGQVKVLFYAVLLNS
jgi:hypothetical protein